MNKDVLGVIGGIVLVFVALFAFRGEVLKLFVDDITADMFLPGDSDSFDPGLPVSTRFPAIRASYQGRVITDLGEFNSGQGMIFIANRSVDWCPYCMRQLAQLQEHLESFQQAGIAVVAMTYDAPELQQPFIEKHQLGYPLLSDIDAASAMALGILNDQYQPGEHHYGIPHPGVYVLDPDMTIVGKLFIEDYASRVDAAAVLAIARDALGLVRGFRRSPK